MPNIIDSLVGTGVDTLLKSAGGFAKDLRTAITGNEPLSNDQKAKLLEISSQLDQAVLNSDKEIALGQVDLDKLDAQSTSFFKSGWRPMIGWICGAGLCYQFIFKNLLTWTMQLISIYYHITITIPVLPELDMGTLLTLLFGMLGLGGFRTFEKLKGVK